MTNIITHYSWTQTGMVRSEDGSYVLRSELEEAKARIAELEKDAERYCWLRDNTTDEIPYRWWWQIAGGAGADKSKLNEAIDAAIKASKEN